MEDDTEPRLKAVSEVSQDDISHLDDPDAWKPVIGDPDAEFNATVELRKSLQDAVSTVIEIASGETVSRLRFDAAKYVIERVLGKPKDAGDDNPWDKLLSALRDDPVGQLGSGEA